jgi:type IV pilus assembly protein PilA
MIVVAIIGVLAALALYGVNQYLTMARTGEAKANVGAIAQLAAAVFEREFAESELKSEGTYSKPVENNLCASAITVPATVPAGTKYQPKNSVGSDFQAGTSSEGWVCLGYTMTTPIYYQYSYQRGANYVSPPLGGPDPGGSGFEAAARGDVDGDGTISTFALSGAVVGKRLRLATQVFIHDELE